jgi:phosphate transport system protein
MGTQLSREIENLNQEIRARGAMAAAAVRDATSALENRDESLARNVIANDVRLDQMGVRIEEDCLKILALHQPVASDPRFLIALLKIDNELERVGDLAVNVAEHAAFLATQPPAGVSFDFGAMACKAQTMLEKSLDSLVHLGAERAREVLVSDDEIDAMNRQMYRMVQEATRAHPDRTESPIHLLSVSQHLEQIADRATNIAEDVIYLTEGVIVRHRAEDYESVKAVHEQISSIPDEVSQIKRSLYVGIRNVRFHPVGGQELHVLVRPGPLDGRLEGKRRGNESETDRHTLGDAGGMDRPALAGYEDHPGDLQLWMPATMME